MCITMLKAWMVQKKYYIFRDLDVRDPGMPPKSPNIRDGFDVMLT
jgi:hypothetical protein